MIRANTFDEYIDWLKQATFDADDLRAFVEYDEEFMGDALVFLDPVEYEIKKLYDDLINNRYEFTNEPLRFMQIVEKNNPTLLPFNFYCNV